jgi:plasmid stabilization system protein ParE
MRSVIWRPEALVEFEDALSWYQERSIFAAQRMSVRFSELLAEIIQNPERFPFSIPGRRWAPLKRSPYQVHYMESEGQIVILAFWHEKRDRQSLHQRLYPRG